MTEEIIDREYLLRPLSDPVDNPRIERFGVRGLRQAELDKAEQYQNFLDYGSEFGEAQAPEPPDWSQFRRACEQHLANKAKDLWVGTWYIEALLLQYGFQGLAEGFPFLQEFIQQCWDQLEPKPDGEDGIAGTMKMLAGLNNGSTFIDQLRLTPITIETGEHPALSCATIDSADSNVRGQLVGNTDKELQEQLAASVQQAVAGFDQLCEALTARCGDDAPPSAKLREALSNCENKLREIYPTAFVVPSESASEDGDAVGEESQVATIAGGGPAANMQNPSHVQNREEAFRMLETVSNFFRDNEPQSPVSYLLEKAVRWGRMPLPDLIKEMVDDDDTKSQIYRLAGIKPETEDEEY